MPGSNSASYDLIAARQRGLQPSADGVGFDVSVVSGGASADVSVNRPANTTAYLANDVVGGVITFPLVARAASPVLITAAELEIDVAAIPVGMGGFRMFLYNAAPPSALADNAPFDLPVGDRASFLGYIDLGSPVDLGSTLYLKADQVNMQRKSVTTSLFAYLVTLGAFTPAANSEVYKATLHTMNL